MRYLTKSKSPIWLGVLLLFLGMASCEEERDPVIVAVEEANATLRNNDWRLAELLVDVKNSDLPPPFMAGVTSDSLQAGLYDLSQIFNGVDTPENYRYLFTEDNEILVDSLGDGNFLSAGSYRVLGSNDIRLGFANLQKIPYQYLYLTQLRTMNFDANEGTASRVIDAYNRLYTRLILNETPNRVGDAIARLLFNNRVVQKAVNDFLVDLISGKLEFVNEIDPVTLSDSLATVIFDEIQARDWQTILADAIEAELEKFTDIDPEAVSLQISENVVAAIQERFTVDAIFEFLLPFMEQVGEKPPQEVAENIAVVITALILDFFDQQKLEEIILPIWENFTKVPDSTVAVVADSLATIVEDNWINQDNLSDRFLPIMEKIDATPLSQMGNLASEVVDSLTVVLDQINATFPDLNLDPDYGAIQTAVRAALVALKPIINSVGTDAAADQIADLILGTFLTHEAIQNVFIAAINALQSIDPQMAADTISTWLANLIGLAEDDLIAFLTLKLSPIVEDFDPDAAALQIATALNQFITDNVTQELVFDLVFPLIEAISNINTELVANYIAARILESDLIKDNITQENIAMLLLPVLEQIKETDTEEVAQAIIDTIVNNDLFKAIVTEERVARTISYLLYNIIWTNFKNLNNFQAVTIALQHD